MLVLNRKREQGIIIAGNIRIRVLSVKGNTVRLGIEAPSEVSILRDELSVTNENAMAGEFPVAAPKVNVPAGIPYSV